MAILERGGVVVGSPHSEGGVPFVIQDTGKHVEEEGGEINIPAEIVNNSRKYEFTGTNAEILNKVLKLGNLSLSDKVTTVKSGDIVICVKSAWDNQIRTIKGTIPEILSAINTSKGCKLIEPGAEVETIAKDGGIIPPHRKNESACVAGNRFFVSQFYEGIKNGTIPYQIQEIETYNPFKHYIRIYDDVIEKYKDKVIDNTKPTGLHLLFNYKGENQIFPVDGNHRMFKLYKEGVKTTHIIIVQDVNAIKKYSDTIIDKNEIKPYREEEEKGQNLSKGGGIPKSILTKETDLEEFKIGDRVVHLPLKYLDKYSVWDIEHNIDGATILSFILGKEDKPYLVRVRVDGKRKGYDKQIWSIDEISYEKYWRDKVKAEKENGQNLSKGGDIQIEDPNSPRWQKKKESIMELSNNIHRLRSKVSHDLNNNDEKEFLTALIIAIMDKTGERVGNGESARNGHYGITGFRKKHITIIGDKIHLSYTGKSGVKHEKSFSDKRLAKALKKAIRKSPNRFIFSTSEGFIIRADKVNRYLDVFKITAKDFRGYNANKWIIEKLQSAEIPKEERERKRKFNAITRKIALKIGHGIGTLKKHYMIPELPEEYIIKGKIIDLKELGYYKEGGNIESDNEPLLIQTGGITDEKKKEAERMAEQFIENLSADDLKSIKQQFESIKDNVIIEEEKNYDILQQKKNSLENERKDLYEKEKPLSFGKEKDELIEQRQKINQELDLIIKPSLIHQENKIKAVKNGGDLSSFTDKKSAVHNNIPYFVKIKTDLILFDEETILTDAIPPYIPLIDEDVFGGKGYIFDAIRIAPDKYLMAVNGYKEKRFSGYYRAGEFTGHPEDVEQGYVMVTLDQLALINDYYFTKAKAVLQKEADKSNLSREQSYDRMPREIRERHLSQKGFYNVLPVNVKKKITQEEYEKLSLEEKEKLYKPFKRHGIKRLTSRLEENQMWVSYHNMYERFINPEAVSPKRGYANQEVFDYWSNFREMMKWKIKDIKIQREVESETRKIALETSFGESNTDNILKEKYGILVKRQDGSKIMPNEIEQIRISWEKINNTFGNLKDNAKNVNLKISHTGLKYVFASKSAGIFIPIMKTIAVSNKFGDNQFESIMAHETAHWIDYSIGQLKGKRHASDDFESTAGLIAGTLRENMNSRSDSDYVNSTAECFARAMEQYFAFENFGEEATLIYSYTPLDEVRTYHSEDKYVSKENFNDKIKPFIRKFLSENESWFNFGIGMKIAA